MPAASTRCSNSACRPIAVHVPAGAIRTGRPALLYLRFLATGPDSHILRKFGPDVANRVQTEAIAAESALLAAGHPAGQTAPLLAWDADLKRRGINPGTSADLTVATILAELCGANLPRPGSDD